VNHDTPPRANPAARKSAPITEINLEKVESVDVDQSILGRIFGYGSVTIRGTGEAVEPLRDIAGPIEFRNAVMGR
jgi:uncharacterized membrane protein YdbT with pleckstrin-like domain